jgi:hypothetical protein
VSVVIAGLSSFKNITGGALSITDAINVSVTADFISCVKVQDGGAIYLKSVTNVVLYNSTFTDCSARNGGAVYFDYEATRVYTRVIKKCVFSNNDALNVGSKGVSIYDNYGSPPYFYNESTVTQCFTNSYLFEGKSQFYWSGVDIAADCLLENNCGIFIYVDTEKNADQPLCGHISTPCKTLTAALNGTAFGREILLLNGNIRHQFERIDFVNYKTYFIRGTLNEGAGYPYPDVETNFTRGMAEYVGRNFTLEKVRLIYNAGDASQTTNYLFRIGNNNPNVGVVIRFIDIRFEIDQGSSFISPLIYKNGNSDVIVAFKSCVFNELKFSGSSCIGYFYGGAAKIEFDEVSFIGVETESGRSMLVHTNDLAQNHSISFLNSNVSVVGNGTERIGLLFSLSLNEHSNFIVNNSRFENISLLQSTYTGGCFYLTDGIVPESPEEPEPTPTQFSITGNVTIGYSTFNNISGVMYGGGMFFCLFGNKPLFLICSYISEYELVCLI